MESEAPRRAGSEGGRSQMKYFLHALSGNGNGEAQKKKMRRMGEEGGKKKRKENL